MVLPLKLPGREQNVQRGMEGTDLSAKLLATADHHQNPMMIQFHSSRWKTQDQNCDSGILR